MSDLLPCPFCGSESVSLSESGLWVMCDNCEGDGPTTASGFCKTPREGWNRREANAPADPALLALAKLGAFLCRNAEWPAPTQSHRQRPAEIAASSLEVHVTMLAAGLSDDVGRPAPGIADAIARLLAPDGAASEGVDA